MACYLWVGPMNAKVVFVTGRVTRRGSRVRVPTGTGPGRQLNFLQTRGYPPQPVGIAQTPPNTPCASTLKTRADWNVTEPTSSSQIHCGFHGSRVTRRPAARPVPVIAGTGFSGYGYGSSRKYPRETRDDYYAKVSQI
ncbi:hypothetical protein FB45DRAFT_873520 [Roridomyces roridus]|uniref:Uncharacterized protein n=1 Tax=Roridomyces roridus TaxID=1738132 RepID=A0AAD7BAU2_9AGAR|nr:hypothetical protein FB45DRAFT_873520 [Roridomyces roridus]